MSEAGFHFARPVLLAALALPVIVWWLARRPRRPVEVATGTLAIWREVAGAPQPAAVLRRRRAPWMVLAALTCGALALAGPRTARAAPPGWRIVVDRSPSMHLAHPAGGTRLERALAAASSELERLEALESFPARRAQRRWLAYDGARFVIAEGAAPPAAWRRAPARPHPEPDWGRLDLPRTLWVSDAAPAVQPRAAGLALSGGAAVPGAAAVGADGGLYQFDGRELARTSGRAGPRQVFVGSSVPEPVRALAALWAAERGLELGADAGAAPRTALAIEGPSPGAREMLRVGRRGWELEVAAAPGGIDPERARQDGDFDLAPVPWLEQGGAVHAAGAAGRVLLSFDRSGAPRGDPAAFAVSWSELFDACLLPPSEVVPLEERLAAGEARVLPPSPAPAATAGAGEVAGAPLEALLAGAAALLVLLGLLRGQVAVGSRDD